MSPECATAVLRTTTAIRERAGQLSRRARDGDSRWFTVEDDALPTAAEAVAGVTRSRYPDLVIPFHSRWRHFEAGGVDRRTALDVLDGPVRARAMIDLAVVSVLLDAGAGPDWRYDEDTTGQSFTRSEGLGVASWHAFTSGLFSSDGADPLRVDAAGGDLLIRGLSEAEHNVICTSAPLPVDAGQPRGAISAGAGYPLPAGECTT